MERNSHYVLCTYRPDNRGQERPDRGLLRPTLLFSFFIICCFFLFAPDGLAQEVRSRSAIVMDASTGKVLYAKNPDLRLLPASTAKLMTALVVLENAELSDVVTVSKRAASAVPTRAGLKRGDKVTVETLLYAALVKSANDAAIALAEAVADSVEEFVELMNLKAIELGISDTRFINPNGLPGEGQYITAYDLTRIMRRVITYPLLNEILGTRFARISTETGKTVTLKNTNKLLWSGENLLKGKTGYTRQARHCFVGVGERDGSSFIVALLGTPSRALLWKEARELLEFGSRVMNNVEHPVAYLNREDYEAPYVTRASFAKRKQ